MKRGQCNLGELFTFVVNITGGVTGVYIFIGAFDVIKVSPQNGLWGGITGLILFLLTLQNVVLELRGIFGHPVAPSEQSKAQRGEGNEPRS